MNKTTLLFFFALCFIIFLATSCKQTYECAPSIIKDDGKEWLLTSKPKVKDPQDCRYNKLKDEDPVTNLDTKIKDFKDLESKLDQIDKECANKKVVLEPQSQWIVDDSGYAILDRLGALKKKHGANLAIDWKSFAVVPANADMLLEYRLWKRWTGDIVKPADFLPLGSYDTNGAKVIYLWNIGEDELQMFLDGGAPGGALAPGDPVRNISSHEDLWETPNYVAENGTTANPVRITFNTVLPGGIANGNDAEAVKALTGVGLLGQALKGKFEFHNPNSQKKQYASSENNPVLPATCVYEMYQNGAWDSRGMASGNYVDLPVIVQGSLDSLGTQYATTELQNSDKLNTSKVAPRNVYVMHDLDPVAFQPLYGIYNGVIKLEMKIDPSKPGDEQNFIKVDNPFLIRLRTASAQEKSGVIPVFQVDGNPILAEYKNTPPSQVNAFRIVELNYGDVADLDGTGAKIEASWFEAGGGGSSVVAPACYSDIQLKVQMTSDEYKSEGKVILDLNWLANQAGIAAGFTSQQTGKFKLSNYKLYLTGPSLYVWENYCHGKLQELFDFYNIIADEANVGIITDLNGKKAFGVEGQVNLAPKRGSKMSSKSAAASYGSYQERNNKTFNGFKIPGFGK